ncbi:MAG: hypothetical protein H6Q80_724 [Deltaproteobacteria bacterium]|jgi:hypothetical protein|nr:hypothetical protein [Deltaproteobacteria bacterium]
MARKILLFLFAGMFVVVLGGAASAEAPIMALYSSEAAIQPSAADPEQEASNSTSWQEREPVETGSMPAESGNSPELRCCSGDNGPTQDQAGNTVLRHGIDDGS